MNIFYVPPSKIKNGLAELTGQEAAHASKVMRVREGDRLVVVDGRGNRYEGPIHRITKKTIQVEIDDVEQIPAPAPELILGVGIIKKKDRLEFAVEKAVELGASQICLFRSEHSVKENVRIDRLQAIARSAMKQSLRAWLPEITLFGAFDSMLEAFPDTYCLAAHEKIQSTASNIFNKGTNMRDKILLLVGPEGGFSANEIDKLTQRDAHLISLGSNRLRTETAALALLGQFLI